jgi:hypothetical protein
MLGLKTSSRTQNVLIIIKVGLVVLLIASIFKGVVIEPHGTKKIHLSLHWIRTAPLLYFLSR